MFIKIKKISLSVTLSIVFSLVIFGGVITGGYLYKVKKADGYIEFKKNERLLFGGRIKTVVYCDNGTMIEVGERPDNRLGGLFLFTEDSKLYKWENLVEQQCVLGEAKPKGACEIDGDEIPVDGIIKMVATTLEAPKKGLCEGDEKEGDRVQTQSKGGSVGGSIGNTGGVPPVGIDTKGGASFPNLP